MDHSENGFTVSEDKTAIYCGFNYIKGEGSVELVRDTDLESFVRKNPKLSEKTVLKYAQLGMFQTIAKNDPENTFSKGGSPACTREEAVWWMEHCYAPFTQALDFLRQHNDLLRNEEPVDKKALNALSEKFKKARAEYDTEKESFTRIPADARKHFTWENELLGVVLSADSLCEKLAGYPRSFADLKDAQYEQDIPAIVVSVSGEKLTKKSKMPYYDVVLMDKNGDRIIRRFPEIPRDTVAMFSLQPDEKPFFFCRERRPLQQGTGHARKNTTVATLSDAVKTGTASRITNIRTVAIPGGETVAVADCEEGEEKI
jgi:hypothetical protein